MIIDAHCHAWHSWPYDADVTDRDRGAVERLIEQFDLHGVDHGLLIAARIGAGDPRTDNRDNNDYLAEALGRYPHRLSLCVDVDSFWDPRHHTDGAADRLSAAIEASPAVGFTHYSAGPYDGWFDSPEGIAFFDRAAELQLIASLHTPPDWQPAIGRLAERQPELPILIHHQGHVPTAEDRYSEEIELLLDNVRHPNIMIKVSGFYYLTADRTGYPYPAVQERFRRLHHHFGPERVVWGSDWPVAGQFLSYRQTCELITTHAPWLTDHDQRLLLGENLRRLLPKTPELAEDP